MIIIFPLALLKNQLFNKEKYVLYYINLQLPMIKNKKVHCILGFDQSKWLKPYFEFNAWKSIEEAFYINAQCCIW